MSYKLHILEDNMLLLQTLEDFLSEYSYVCTLVKSGKEALEACYQNSFDLYLVDVKVPDMNGFEFLQALRHSGDRTPAIFITSLNDQESVRKGFLIGGDDYIKKPYSLSVLLAKVKVIIKRYDGVAQKVGSSEVVSAQLEAPDRCGNLRIDKDAMKVYRYDKDVGFKTKEFKLFLYLYENKNRVIAKDELFAKIWGDAFFSDGTLNVHIRKIREKIEENPNQPRLIKTIWGTGYIFETEENE